MAIVGSARPEEKTGTVTIQVPLVRCIICDAELPVSPTKVHLNRAVEWDPPPGWRRALVEDVGDKKAYVYFCATGCTNKLPAIPKFGPR